MSPVTLLASGGHEAVPHILLGLAVILLAAKAGGEVFERLSLPAVLGELVVGILLGNLGLAGVHTFDFLRAEETFVVLAEIGVVLLLFEVGLESSVKEMMAVGAPSLLVAVVGVVAPSLLGFGVSMFFHPEGSVYVHLFVGTILCATSVGITARVLQDLNGLQRRESKIILGAAVIDDVLGLVVLATVTGMIRAADSGGTLQVGEVAAIVGKAAGFLVVSVIVGLWLSPRMFRVATHLRSRGMLLAVSLAFCFALSYAAHVVGLAPIVGAFTAGLILEEVHYRSLATKENVELHHVLKPLTAMLVPVFFVLMGLKVDLRVFADPSVLGFAAVLTAVAILGKQACSLAIREKGLDRVLIGFGMIPRGEVGLIFAGIGATLVLAGEAVVSPPIFSAAVIMVMVTTLVTPSLLKRRLARSGVVRT
ncbi:MAG: cation:proton antiporter [Planctomycetes bacterium]|nr:cation:proton antiporter [Planctomycetota bacterium]